MLCHYNVHILNICMKEFDLEIIISDKMTAVRTYSLTLTVRGVSN